MKVLVFGTFDLFHEGHKDLLKQARRHGDFLRVVVARDINVSGIKGKSPMYSEQERVDAIRKTGLADEVLLGGIKDKFEVINDFKPDVICLGYDQQQSQSELRNKLNEFGLDKTKIIRLKAYKPEIYKSSLLKAKLK